MQRSECCNEENMDDLLELDAAASQIYFSTTDAEIAERFQALYRFHLLLRCFRRWCAGLSCHTKARLYDQRRILSKALFALQQAALLQHARMDTAERGKRALMLAQAFHQWKDVYERRQQAKLGSDSCTQGHIVALRRRLVKASDVLPLRITYCAWRSQGQQIHRAAVIHHHLSVLYKHWLLWRQAWLKQTSRARQMWQACLWREERLRSRAWTAWLCMWQKRHKNRHLHRLVLQRWHQHTQRAQLMHLAEAEQQLRSIRTLSATFRRWKQAKEMRETVRRLCHLQGRGILHAAFEKWLHSSQVKLWMKKLHKRRCKAQLARCFSYWKDLVLHKTLLAFSCRRQQILTVRSFFQQWRRHLELCLLQKHFLILLFFKRQQTSQHTSAVQDESMAMAAVEPSGQHSLSSLEELQDRLVLQASVYTWKEKLKKQQLARWHHAAHVSARRRAELVEWHRLAQAELSDKVLRFRARLEQFHAPLSTPGFLSSSDPGHASDYTSSGGHQVLEQGANHAKPDPRLQPSACASINLAEGEQHCPLQASSPPNKHTTRFLQLQYGLNQGYEATNPRDVGIFSSPHQSFPHHCRGKAVALLVLIRMMQPDLSLAFSQWRSVIHSSRQMKQQADLFRNSRKLTGIRLVFSTWRTHTETKQRAVHYRKRVLLSHCVTDWRKLMWCRHRERCLQLQAIHVHQTKLMKHSFSAWHSQAEFVLNSGPGWLEQRVERRRLSWAFSTWAAHARQQKAVNAFYTQMLLTRVFAAWQKRVQHHKERQEAALSFVQHRRYTMVFSQWKSSWARQQLANSRAKHTLCLSGKHMLQGWREYTHNRCRMHVQLCAFIDGRKRALKRRAILIWTQAVENIKTVRHFYQRALLSRAQGKWWEISARVWVGHRVSLGLGQRIYTLTVLHVRAVLYTEQVGFYTKWLCVSGRNRKLRCLSQDLQKLRVQKLLQSTFTLWKIQFLHICTKKHCIHFQIDNFQFHQAASHQDQHLLALSLRLWRWKLEMTRKRREVIQEAVRIWRQCVLRHKEDGEKFQNVQKLHLSHAFQYWARVVRLSIRGREHHTQKQRRRVLLAWHIHTVSAQRMRYSEACFQYRMELRVMDFSFSLWKRAQIQNQNQQCALEDLLSLYHSRLTAQAFQNWRAATIHSRAARKINTALLQKWFVCWTQRRDVLSTAILFHARKQKEEARLILTSWSLWAKEHKGRRQMEEAVSLWLDGRRVCTVFHQWVKVYYKHQVACDHSQIHLLHRMFWTWRTAAIETKEKCQIVQVRLRHLQIQLAFRTWRWAATSHKSVHYFTRRVKEADRKRLLSAVLQAWHKETQTQKQLDLHLSEKYFTLWAREVQRRQCERTLWDRRRTKWLRLWRYRLVEQREQRELSCLYWESWKSQTAASLLYTQQNQRKSLQKAWLTWRKRHIRNRVVADYTASLNRALLLKAFRVWWRRALVSGFLPSRGPARSYSV